MGRPKRPTPPKPAWPSRTERAWTFVKDHQILSVSIATVGVLAAAIIGVWAVGGNGIRVEGNDGVVVGENDGTVVGDNDRVVIGNNSGNVTINQGTVNIQPSTRLATVTVRLQEMDYLLRLGRVYCSLQGLPSSPDAEGRCTFRNVVDDGARHRLEVVTIVPLRGELLAGWRSILPGVDADVAFVPDAPHEDRHFDWPSLSLRWNDSDGWHVTSVVKNGELEGRDVTVTCAWDGGSASTRVHVSAGRTHTLPCAHVGKVDPPPSQLTWTVVTHYPEGDRMTDFGTCHPDYAPNLLMASCPTPQAQ